MQRKILCFGAVLLVFSGAANAATFRFDTDPFAGSDAPTTPGRQVVGGEPSITFNIATDIFSIDPSVFGVSNVNFINDIAANIPGSGVNVVVLQTLDNDNDPLTPFGAGNAASLIAAQIATATPGFFIYFNQGLDLPRLVFSVDLDDSTADLKILARMVNFEGQPEVMPTFTAANFEFAQAPEPTGLLLMMVGAVAAFGGRALRRRRAGP
jgi:hypothetical protein